MFTDCHSHTNASYCCDPGLAPESYVAALKAKTDFERVFITDHSMALYFPTEVAWGWKYITDSSVFDAHKDFGDTRLDAHLAKLSKFKDSGVLPGIETEMMHDGRFTFNPEFRPRLAIMIGSVHWLPLSKEAGSPPDEILRLWTEHTLGIIDSGVDILGHPFRWLAYQLPCPVERRLIKETVSRAKAAGVALELNSHYKIDTDVEMLREAAGQGAAVAFATDAHRPDELLDFSYHLAALEKAGLKLSDLKLYDP